MEIREAVEEAKDTQTLNQIQEQVWLKHARNFIFIMNYGIQLLNIFFTLSTSSIG